MQQEIDYEEWEIAEGMFASLTDAFGLRLNYWWEVKRNLNSPNFDTTPT